MSSVFSSLIRPPTIRRASTNTQEAAIPTRPGSSHGLDEPDLRDLNVSLQALTDIFPDIQPEVFREMLSSFSEESRLQVITETLLKHGHKYVRGRYRMPAEQEEQRETAQTYKYRRVDEPRDTRGKPLALEDTFRSIRYRESAKEALYQEFKGLSHSTIKAVLAEYNWSYTQARPTLLGLSSRSWRSSITNFLMRRKAPTANDHPLVIWAAADPRTNRPRLPLLVKTKSDELNRELYESLIVPEQEKQRREQLQQDFELAMQWNEEEAEKEGEMYDCECCFIPNTLQQMSACDVDGHYICFRCIRHSINAALYDQGWARNINTEVCTLKCVAPMMDGSEDCKGCVPLPFVKRALLEEQDGQDTFDKLDERFANEALIKSQLPLVRCPFCSYAELDDFSCRDGDLFANVRFQPRYLSFGTVASAPLLNTLLLFITQLFAALTVFIYSLIISLSHSAAAALPFYTPIQSALRRIHLKRRGLRFQCLSPTCSRASCLTCSAPWHDPHTCYSSQLTSLRLTLERATTDAVKRTCPQCNLGFVKSEGCNKLVCLCGYSMCYVCREGLADQGYSHFCQHFRDRPGAECAECRKCDLYRVEDEERVVGRAKERAEREWWESQGEGKKEGLEKEVRGKGSWDAWVGDVLESVFV
ncbi:hypothetical protein HBI56_149050 [Parastagonospora nodorum]|nr:hypothetical protein HBH52_070280 [Parastagonospora nodorum]KAH3995686.1 hypothetical protein HBI10_169880 [Parastagonospora nodorum]KAH4015843.1 hypothetical protein HBI13_159470 [Parastagonospora nodorum]KAH4107291.1 hypothetical protein HBH46_060710 [Parastagonospora nodorum]KAH4124994.1 hypothetical protein HBH47_062500 [Parastagonospora nodorum]